MGKHSTEYDRVIGHLQDKQYQRLSSEKYDRAIGYPQGTVYLSTDLKC